MPLKFCKAVISSQEEENTRCYLKKYLYTHVDIYLRRGKNIDIYCKNIYKKAQNQNFFHLETRTQPHSKDANWLVNPAKRTWQKDGASPPPSRKSFPD